MKQLILFSTITLLWVTAARAQLNPTLYHIKDLPLNSQLNPAFQPRNGSVYVGIPLVPLLAPTSVSGMLSGEYFTLGNAYLSPDYKAIATGAGDFSALTFDGEFNLINFGFMLKDMYLSFDSKIKLNIDGRIPKDLERLMWYGNGHEETLGETLSLEGLGVSLLGYGEISLGISKEVARNLLVGAKFKYLQGLANAQVGFGKGTDFTTDTGSYKISVGLNPDIFLSGLPVTAPQGSFPMDSLISAGLGSYKFDAGNMGVAFDFGGSWDLPWVKGLNVSASVLDVGFISWKGQKVTQQKPGSNIEFEGISLGGGTDFTSGLLDSVKQKTTVTSASVSERQWLSPTVYVGASYEVAKYLNAGALFGYRFLRYENLPMFALSANTQGFMVNGSVSYSYYNRNSNVGVGLLVGRRVVQWHIIADNLLAANFKTAQNVNVRMGLNILLGKGRAKRSEPLAEGDALDASPNTTAGFSPELQPDMLSIAPDTAAATPRYRQTVQDSVKKRAAAPVAKKSAKPAKKMSREDLLKRAMQEEMEAGETVKKKKKPPVVAPKSEKKKLLERALREEADDKNVKVKGKNKK
ncbi:MAG: DUF5723 family protein [Prevotellaceae bacterium]|jgi:hypothetical protein|nr:DUF5723 family protein [Prevotellaceae bacterium]